MFYLLHLFRSFIPTQNPIGFGASDFVEFLIAAALLALVLARQPLLTAARKLAAKPIWSMLALGGLTVALRLAMLPAAGAPIPGTADDDSYLLLAGTLRHFRLANPTHPLYRFFESNFILQQPSYSSIFPLGQGIALALGRAIFGHAWAGVLLSEALLCALCYWMLCGWISSGWALLGGLLAVFELGPLSYWMNSYWGGAVSGIAGCLVFGALPRLCKQGGTRNAILLGTGLGLELLTRPYESVFLTAIVAVTFLLPKWRKMLTSAPPEEVPRTTEPRPARPSRVPERLEGLAGPVRALVIAATLPAVALVLAQNKAVTGSWTTLPYMASQIQYGIPASFTFQPDPQPRRELTQEQRDDYKAQTDAHDQERARSWFDRVVEHAEDLRFYSFPALLAAIPGLLLVFRERRLLLPAGAVVVFLAGSAFYPFFFPHYVAALACVFLLLIAASLKRMPPAAAYAVCGVAIVHFGFWYGVHLRGDRDLLNGFGPYESVDFVNHGDPEGRLPILATLDQAHGNQLVFVHYSRFHPLREWIANEADIDHSKIVWALDLGRDENRELTDYYPDRTAWLVEPDARPPRIRPYLGF